MKCESTEKMSDAKLGMILNIQRYSIHDGAGIRTTIFFKGCPMQCIWCSNPESQHSEVEMYYDKSKCIGCGSCLEDPKNCPTNAKSFWGKKMSVEELKDEALKDWLFYKKSGGGITLSGGEPLCQTRFLMELTDVLGQTGINMAIETCGLFAWDKAEPILNRMDTILFDIKCMDADKHRQYTGVGNERILNNAKKASLLSNKMIIRIPVIGGYNADEENIRKTAAFAKEIGVKEIHLLPYHRLGEVKYKKLGRDYLCKGHTPDSTSICRLKKIIEAYEINTKIGG